MEALDPHINQVIYSVVAFFILLVVLNRIAFPPIMSMLGKRSETIKESLDAADRTREEAAKLLDDYKEQMAKARDEAKQITEQGRKFGETMKEDIVQKARDEAEHMITKARADIEREKELALTELRQNVADLTIDAASRVVNRSLNKRDHQQLIDEYLAEVGRISDS